MYVQCDRCQFEKYEWFIGKTGPGHYEEFEKRKAK